MSKLPLGTRNHKYKIIIPQEEPKQETLEEKLDKIVSKEPSKFWKESDERFEYREALDEASKYYAHNYFEMHETNSYKELKRGFIAGANWQQEQDKNKYSEEDVEIIIQKLMNDVHCGDLCYGDNVIDFKMSPRQWFEQFKNK
jgi:hypothetical protein